MTNGKDLQRSTEERGQTVQLPAHDAIEKGAYELYLKSGEELSATEYWLMTEEYLNNKIAMDATEPLKSKIALVGRVMTRNN